MPQHPLDDPFYSDVKAAFIEHAPSVRRTLTHLGATDQEAEDAMQDAVSAILSRRPHIEHPGAYLTRASRNHWYTMLRTQKRTADVDAEGIAELPDCPTRNPVNHVIADEYQHRVVAALEKLPQAHREAFVLRADERFSFAEIARITDRKESTVRQHHKRATAALRALLSE